jgi:long-subunit acyl-CoA synthetase (AMP-forming)
MSSSTEQTTICAAFRATVARQPREVALRTVGGGTTITWAQYAERVRRIAAGLAELGVGRGDTVALLLTNRPEFHLIDTAAQHLGAVPFSCYQTSSPEQIDYLLADSGARVAVTESRFAPVFAGRPLRALVLIEDLEELIARGDPGFSFGTVVRPADLLTLVYTSGTTGPPKGVEITHGAMVAMAEASAQALGVCADIGGARRRPRPPSMPRAGCTPGTSRRRPRTATCGSSTARRTW